MKKEKNFYKKSSPCTITPQDIYDNTNFFKEKQPQIKSYKLAFISSIIVVFLSFTMIAILSIQNYKLQNKEPENSILTRFDIERIMLILGEHDNVKRIYINFCNPWPKKKHNKKRLTHPRQLVQYKEFLSENGKIYFKTDSDELFEASLEYFKEAEFEIEKITYDLHNEPIFEENVITEHEKMFSDEGIKIKALIAKMQK